VAAALYFVWTRIKVFRAYREGGATGGAKE